MRNVLLLCLIMLIAFITGCKEKVTEPIDFWGPDWYFQQPFVLAVYSAQGQTKVAYQNLYLLSNNLCSSITINGNQYNVTQTGYSNGTYTSGFDYDFDEDGPLANPGETCRYSFLMNDVEYSGSVIVPHDTSLTLPVFDMNIDYTMSWNSVSDPNHYLLFYCLSQSEFEGDVNGATGYTQFYGTQKSYTLPKSTWDHMDVVETACFEFRALNFSRHESGGFAVSWHSQDNVAEINGFNRTLYQQPIKEAADLRAQDMIRMIRDGGISLSR